MKLNLIFFLVYPWNFFSLIRFKKKPNKILQKKTTVEHVNKKIKCNLYAVCLLSPIEPHRCPVYMYFVKFYKCCIECDLQG